MRTGEGFPGEAGHTGSRGSFRAPCGWRHLATPGPKVQVVKRDKFPAIQEVVFGIAVRLFNFALDLGPVDPAEPGSESKVVPEVNKRRMEL